MLEAILIGTFFFAGYGLTDGYQIDMPSWEEIIQKLNDFFRKVIGLLSLCFLRVREIKDGEQNSIIVVIEAPRFMKDKIIEISSFFLPKQEISINFPLIETENVQKPEIFLLKPSSAKVDDEQENIFPFIPSDLDAMSVRSLQRFIDSINKIKKGSIKHYRTKGVNKKLLISKIRGFYNTL